MMAGAIHDWIHLRRNQSLPAPRLRELQQRRLKRMLAHAFANVPFYQRIWSEHGLSLASLASLDTPDLLPVLDRSALQPVVSAELLSRTVDPASCIVRHTGGSSARPIGFSSLPSEVRYETLGWLRTWRRLGMGVFDRQLTIKHPDDIVLRDENRWFQRLGLMRVEYLDLRDPIPALLDQVSDTRPDILRAPPSVLLALAREIEVRDTPSRAWPRLVFCTGERLSRPTARELQRVLGAPIRDCYGATEAGCIGWRCPRCDLFHLNSDFLWIEVLKDGRQALPGELGELVVTNLYRQAMPVLRLGLGDLCEIAAPNHCPDAIGDLSLARIAGRTMDSLRLRDGSEISPYGFMPDEIEGVLAYQIQQAEWGELEVLVLPDKNLQLERLHEAKRVYESHLEGRLSVQFRFVDQLPTKSLAPTPTDPAVAPGD